MNNTINTDNNNSSDINTSVDKSVDNIVDNNSTSRANNTTRNLTCKQKLLNAHGDKPTLKRAKVTSSHILTKYIIVVVEEIQASREERQETIKARGELEALVALEFSKTQFETTEKLHNSQVEATTRLHESQTKLACTPIEKGVSELVDRYVEDDGLLVKELEIMKNESSVLTFISLSKVLIVQKHWLIIECNK